MANIQYYALYVPINPNNMLHLKYFISFQAYIFQNKLIVLKNNLVIWKVNNGSQ